MARLVDIEEVKAVIEWQHDGITRCLWECDPPSSSIRFALRLDASCALFEIIIPIKYKDHWNLSAIYIHINPQHITSLKHFIKDNVPDASNPVFPSATCLDLQLDNKISILIPTFVKEPVVAYRPRSGKILDSLYELLHASSLRIYIPHDALSLEQLDTISTTVAQHQLKPFSGLDFDVTRLFAGSGAKITTLPRPPPPSYKKVAAQTSVPLYNESVIYDPPSHNKATAQTSIPSYNESVTDDPPSHKRKRSQESAEKGGPLWAKLLELEAEIQQRAPQKVIQEQCAQIADLQVKLAASEQRVKNLEAEVAELRQAQDYANEVETVELTELREDVKELEGRIDFVMNGNNKDFEETIMKKVLEEMMVRVSRT